MIIHRTISRVRHADVRGHCQLQCCSVPVGSILHDEMESLVHRTCNESDSVFITWSVHVRDWLWADAEGQWIARRTHIGKRSCLLKVFIEEPYGLHTIDIQTAFNRLALKKAQPWSIPVVDRQLHPSKPSMATSNSLQRPLKRLETIGIKHISLTLILSIVSEISECASASSIRSFQHDTIETGSLVVDIEIYGDGQKVGYVSTKSIPILRKYRRPLVW